MKITLTLGRQSFAPIQFHSFEVGPLSAEIEIPDGAENKSAAVADQVEKILAPMFEQEMDRAMKLFFANCKKVDDYMAEQGMQIRSQAAAAINPKPQPQASQEQSVSQPQRDLIFRLASAKHVDPNKLAKDEHGCVVADLTKSQASGIIDILNGMPPPQVVQPEPTKQQVVTNARLAENAPEEPQRDKIEFPADPVAKTLAEMVTTKQLGMIRAVAREAGVDADVICSDLLQCKISELSRRAASALIDHLRNLSAAAEKARSEVSTPPTEPTTESKPKADDESPF